MAFDPVLNVPFTKLLDRQRTAVTAKVIKVASNFVSVLSGKTSACRALLTVFDEL
jgi:hypothetical protein